VTIGAERDEGHVAEPRERQALSLGERVRRRQDEENARAARA